MMINPVFFFALHHFHLLLFSAFNSEREVRRQNVMNEWWMNEFCLYYSDVYHRDLWSLLLVKKPVSWPEISMKWYRLLQLCKCCVHLSGKSLFWHFGERLAPPSLFVCTFVRDAAVVSWQWAGGGDGVPGVQAYLPEGDGGWRGWRRKRVRWWGHGAQREMKAPPTDTASPALPPRAAGGRFIVNSRAVQ